MFISACSSREAPGAHLYPLKQHVLRIAQGQPGRQAKLRHLFIVQDEDLVGLEAHRRCQTHIVGVAVEHLAGCSEACDAGRGEGEDIRSYVSFPKAVENTWIQL